MLLSILKAVEMSQYTQGEDSTLQFFSGYLHVKCWAMLAGFLPEMKGLQDTGPSKQQTSKITHWTPRPGLADGIRS